MPSEHNEDRTLVHDSRNHVPGGEKCNLGIIILRKKSRETTGKPGSVNRLFFPHMCLWDFLILLRKISGQFHFLLWIAGMLLLPDKSGPA